MPKDSPKKHSRSGPIAVLVLIGSVATAALGVLGVPSYGETIYSYAFSKQYIVTISRDALEKCPAWEDNHENPPIGARKAIQLANEMKDSLVKDSTDFKWALRHVSLEPAGNGKWYWLVHYDAVFQGGASSGQPPFLRLAILMDGTVIKPMVKDYP